MIVGTSCSNNACYDNYDYVLTHTEISSDSIFVFNDENKVKIHKLLDPSLEDMENFLLTEYNTKLSDLGFFIYDLYTGARIDEDTTFVGKQFGIYNVHLLNNQSELVLTNGSNFTFVRISYMDYDEVLMYLIQYFKDNDIDERLLPIYVNRVSRLWLNNARRYHQFGKWYKWFNEPDKVNIAKEYKEYMDFLK